MIHKTHMELWLKDHIPVLENHSNDLKLIKLNAPSYDTYRDLHNRVGAPYGWDQRARINDIAAMTILLANPGVELWKFYDGSTLIGYALFTCAANKTAELEDFGFFPEYNAHGYGKFFLSKILDRLSAIGIEKVWLTTRSTNHEKVISFYEKMRFEVTGEEPV